MILAKDRFSHRIRAKYEKTMNVLRLIGNKS